MKSDERGLSRKHIIESVKASLQRLQLPYVDIVIIHKADPMCPMEGQNSFRIQNILDGQNSHHAVWNIFLEVVRAMTYIIEEGYSMYWGTSRWSHCEVNREEFNKWNVQLVIHT